MENNCKFNPGTAALLSIILAILGLITARTPLASVPSQEFQLGAGDRISIRVYGEQDLTLETLLSDSGVINYPFLGVLEIAGLTPMQLEEKIVNGLKGDYLVNPVVHVSIVEYRPFFIDGEVASPGAYAFQPGLTIAKAVALAGGFTERGSREKIYIERGEEGTKEKMKADLSASLRPGDIINIEQRFF